MTCNLRHGMSLRVSRTSTYCDSYVCMDTDMDWRSYRIAKYGLKSVICMPEIYTHECAIYEQPHRVVILCVRIWTEDCVEMSDVDRRNIRFVLKRLNTDGLKNVFWMNQNMEISSWHVKNPTVLWFLWIRIWIEGCKQISTAGWIFCGYLQISSWRQLKSHRSVIVWIRPWIEEHICD